MKNLTPKQEAFCVAYLEESNATQAYMRSHKPGSTNPRTLIRNAKRVLDHPLVQERLAELRRPAAERAGVTLESHLERLRQLCQRAEDEGKYSAAVAAEIARGKAAGLYVEKVEHAGDGGGPLQIVVKRYSET